MHAFSTTPGHFLLQLRRTLCRVIFLIALIVLGAAPKLLADSSHFYAQHPRIATGYYVIADFDGDRLPDVATVRAERSSQPFTSYSIDLKLSGSADSALQLVAPRGGLEILARDVNGDAFTDLIIITATDSRLIAVLVNDGHGKFALANPRQFPGIAEQPNSHFSAHYEFVAGQSLLPPSRGNFDSAALHTTVFGSPILCSDASPAHAPGIRKTLFDPRSGRSPPASPAAR